MKILVTGARGFIGAHFIRTCLALSESDQIVAFARNTNGWSRARLEDHYDVEAAIRSGQVRIAYGDLLGDISGLCEGVDAVAHFGAKTYVDHSIRDPLAFLESNTTGTLRLLEEARRQKVKAFVGISTDEVYGQILEGAYGEDAPVNPRNPYAASKAGADAFVQSYAHTFGMWTAVTRTENNYGTYQHPQKVIPVFVRTALQGKKLPVYGDGQHIRQWLHVTDHCRAVALLLSRWHSLPSGEVWHVAGSQEITNLELAKRVLKALNLPEDQIEHIDDMNIRPGHDRRYALLCEKMNKQGWQPTIQLDQGLADCVAWYKSNERWLGISSRVNIA